MGRSRVLLGAVAVLVLVGVAGAAYYWAISAGEEQRTSAQAEGERKPADSPRANPTPGSAGKSDIDCRLEAAVDDLGKERVEVMLADWTLGQMQVLNPDASMSPEERGQRIDQGVSEEDFYRYLETLGYRC